jgi:hypothetical protein
MGPNSVTIDCILNRRKPKIKPVAMGKCEPLSVPRITRLLALAIKFQEMVDRGEVRDYADLARLGHVSRARITQIMNLSNLAPDIQEDILLCHAVARAISERHLRCVTSEVSWQHQRRRWHKIRPAK